jgi:serine phosphatase RsbU (regulator of sigma subunit)/ligand-binding sensor domain-containing protein
MNTFRKMICPWLRMTCLACKADFGHFSTCRVPPILSNKILFLINLAILYLAPRLLAQSHDLEFERISLEQGLSQSVVTCILQDSKGFLWFGTMDGLNKYDGYGFTVYKHDAQDVNSLTENGIMAIYEDRSGMLWIGTRDGLNRFDRLAERFTRFLHDPANPNSLSHNSITAICEDRTNSESRLWIGTSGGGLELFDRKSERFIHYRRDAANPNSSAGATLSSNQVRAIHVDQSGVIWVGTSDGLNKLVLDKSDGYAQPSVQFTHFKHDANDPQSLSQNLITSIYEDRAGNLWLTTFGGGLSLLSRGDRASGRFKRYVHEAANQNSLHHNTARSIFEDQSGMLWIGTSGGLDQFDPARASFKHYQNDPANPYSLSNNDVWSVYEDKTGTLWVGTYGGGLNKFSRAKEKFAHVKNDPANPKSLGHNMVMSICESRQGRDGTLWVGTGGGGLYQYDGRQEKFIRYRHDSRNPFSLSNDGVAAIWEDKSGTLWIGTGEGLNRFDREEQSFIRYQHDAKNPHSLSDKGVSVIYEDRAGTLWVGTGAGGLNRFNRASGNFIRYQHDPEKATSLSDNTIVSIFEDSSNDLWIGTARGLNKLERTSGRFIRYQHDSANPKSLSNNRVFSIHADFHDSGVLWIGTWGGGLDKFDKTTGTFTHFTERDGLPNGVIYGILGDDDGNLWLSTNNGLSKFNPSTKTFRNYDVDDGLQSNEFNQGAYFKSKSGEMFFGGINGFNRFHPRRVIDNPHVPPIVLTAFSKFDKLAKLDTCITEIKRLKLSYRDNFFSFVFAALDYTNPAKNQYAYKLEGFDEDWIYCGIRRYASYTNLDGGEYAFRVKGANSDGVWNEQGIAIKIIVTPPFWKTWWFVSLSALLLAFLGYGIYRHKLHDDLEKAHISSELKAAHDMQMGLMPTSDPVVDGFDISGICRPAEAVGGDFFDYFWLDEEKTKFGIALVDVSDKAMKGALTAVMTSGMVNSEAGYSQSPSIILQKINTALYRKTEKNAFTTMSLAVIDTEKRTLTFANAGMTEPLISRNGEIRYLKIEGKRLPLGIHRKVLYDETMLPLQAGDLIVLYTDGLPEAMNAQQEQFDFARMEMSLRQVSRTTRAAQVVKRLLYEVEKFSGGVKPHDDLTLVVIRVL